MLSIMIGLIMVSTPAGPETIMTPLGVQSMDECRLIASRMNMAKPSEFGIDDQGRKIIMRSTECMFLDDATIEEAVKLKTLEKLAP